MRLTVPKTTALGITLAASLALVVVLTRQLHDLGQEYQQVRRLATTLHEGSYVPPVRVAQLDGDSVTLGAVPDRGERQVLFLFTTTCPYCRATLPTWRALADSLRRTASRIQVLGVSLDSARVTRDYRAAHQLNFPVGLLASLKYVALYKAMAVPQTVVLDADGRVRYATIGTLGTRAILDSIYHAALDVDPPATRIVAGRSPASRSDR